MNKPVDWNTDVLSTTRLTQAFDPMIFLHRSTALVIVLAVVVLVGCSASEQTASGPQRPAAPASQINAVEQAANTEDPKRALQILSETSGSRGPVLLTVRGGLRAEVGRYAPAARDLARALRLVEKGRVPVADASLPPVRPGPGKQEASGDLPPVAAEQDLLKTLRQAVNGMATNEDLLRALEERSVPVRYPPLYEGGPGLTLEVLRQHFDGAFRLRLLPYVSTSAEGRDAGPDQGQMRRLAAQNIVVASVLARDATHLKEARESLREVLSESGGGTYSLRKGGRPTLCLALAEYLLGRDMSISSLPVRARRLFAGR